MKKYSIHQEDGRKPVTLRCTQPKVGTVGHDLVCINDDGETVAYFYTFCYWVEVPEDAAPVLAAVQK